MRNLSKLIILLVILFVQNLSYGHWYTPTSSRSFTSSNGEYILKTALPDKFKKSNPTIWKETTCLIFQYEPKNISYKLVRKFDINGDPSEFFINNAGTRIVTIGQKGSFNKGQVAAVFDTTGSLLKEWTLKQVFNVKNIFDDERVMKFSTSSGGISWRGRAMWSHKKNCVRIDFPYHIDLDKLVLTQHFDSDYYLIDVDKLEIIIKSQPKKSKIIK